jgi:16S rRNA (uracil1498-N3)-methyltransferase
MSYFIYNGNIHIDQQFEADLETSHHLKVRRAKVGERFNFQDVGKKRYACEIVKIDKKLVRVKPVGELSVPAVPQPQVVLFQALVMETALDWILQKSTELGVSKIILFNSERTAVKLGQSKISQKQIRWNKIILEAVKQSDRVSPPELEFYENIETALLKIQELEKLFLLDLAGSKLTASSSVPKNIGLIVGPEGGFSELEKASLKQIKNLEVLKLSENTLRAETASVAGLALILNTNL